MNILMILGLLIVAFVFIVIFLPHEVAAVMIAIASAVFLIYCSFPRGSGNAEEGEFYLYGTDTPAHELHGIFSLKYNFSVEPADPGQPWYLELVLADSEENLYTSERNSEYRVFSSEELTDSEVYAGEPADAAPGPMKINSWGWWWANPASVEYTVNGKKYHFPMSRYHCREESWCLLRGSNIHLSDLTFRYKDGYIVCFQNAIGSFFVNYIGAFAGSGVLFLLILAGICVVSGLVCGRLFRQGVLSGVIAVMLGQILMDLWIQFPLLRSGFMKPLYSGLTGFMNTIGSRVGMTAAFAPYTGVGGVILLIILMVVRLIILIYAAGLKQIFNFRTFIAFLAAFVLQGILYAPIYCLQSQFIWLALGLMVVFGAVLIFAGTGFGFFEMAKEGIEPGSAENIKNNDPEIEKPQRPNDIVFGDDGRQYGVGKDPLNGNTLIYDENNRPHIARDAGKGRLLDQNGNEYW